MENIDQNLGYTAQHLQQNMEIAAAEGVHGSAGRLIVMIAERLRCHPAQLAAELRGEPGSWEIDPVAAAAILDRFPGAWTDQELAEKHGISLEGPTFRSVVGVRSLAGLVYLWEVELRSVTCGIRIAGDRARPAHAEGSADQRAQVMARFRDQREEAQHRFRAPAPPANPFSEDQIAQVLSNLEDGPKPPASTGEAYRSDQELADECRALLQGIGHPWQTVVAYFERVDPDGQLARAESPTRVDLERVRHLLLGWTREQGALEDGQQIEIKTGDRLVDRYEIREDNFPEHTRIEQTEDAEEPQETHRILREYGQQVDPRLRVQLVHRLILDQRMAGGRTK